MKERAKRSIPDIVLAMVFAVAVSLPALGWWFDVLPDIEVNDNRSLAPMPKWENKKRVITEYPHAFEAHYGDHMGLRGVLIGAYRWFTQALLRSPDKVTFGEEGWLYLRRGVGRFHSSPLIQSDYCGRRPLGQEALDVWVKTIASNQKRVEALGSAYVFLIAPNKQTVYPQYLPSRIGCRPGETRTDQLVAALAAHGGINFVDLRATLKTAAEDSQLLWYRTDTHWNGHGVGHAYRYIMEHLRLLEPGIPATETVFVREFEGFLGDMGRMISITRPLPETGYPGGPVKLKYRDGGEMPRGPGFIPDARITRIDDPALPSTLVFHDSFFEGAMTWLLAQSFSRALFVPRSTYRIRMGLVQKEKPDLVIHEIVERKLLTQDILATQ